MNRQISISGVAPPGEPNENTESTTQAEWEWQGGRPVARSHGRPRRIQSLVRALWVIPLVAVVMVAGFLGGLSSLGIDPAALTAPVAAAPALPQYSPAPSPVAEPAVPKTVFVEPRLTLPPTDASR